MARALRRFPKLTSGAVVKTNAAERILRETNDLRDAEHLVNVEGLSSARVCVLLNRLVAAMDHDEQYLEIGTWQGRTLLSAAFGNSGRTCIGCDKFRVWSTHTGFGHRAKRKLFENARRYQQGSATVRVFDVASKELFRRRL